jgi:hypothetical protein
MDGWHGYMRALSKLRGVHQPEKLADAMASFLVLGAEFKSDDRSNI